MERKANCEVEYVDLKTGLTFKETFVDPFLYKLQDGLTVAFYKEDLVAVKSLGAKDVLVRWDGTQWTLGVSYCGRPIFNALTTVSDLSVPPKL
jgi:hypothetical protein